jgi:hypothetical protein
MKAFSILQPHRAQYQHCGNFLYYDSYFYQSTNENTFQCKAGIATCRRRENARVNHFGVGLPGLKALNRFCSAVLLCR